MRGFGGAKPPPKKNLTIFKEKKFFLRENFRFFRENFRFFTEKFEKKSHFFDLRLRKFAIYMAPQAGKFFTFFLDASEASGKFFDFFSHPRRGKCARVRG